MTYSPFTLEKFEWRLVFGGRRQGGRLLGRINLFQQRSVWRLLDRHGSAWTVGNDNDWHRHFDDFDLVVIVDGMGFTLDKRFWQFRRLFEFDTFSVHGLELSDFASQSFETLTDRFALVV
jgi:hypothetical protein